MANVNAPFGLKPVRMANGSKNIPIDRYSIADNYTTKIHTGTVVERTGTGTNVVPAAAGNADNEGVFVGCNYKNIFGERVFSNYYPGDANATGIEAFVVSDPNVVYYAQCDTLAAGDVGALADFDAGTASDLYGKSGYEVDVSATTATSGKSLRILRLAPIPGNEYGAYAIAEVMIHEHALGPTAGVGV